MFDHCLYFNTTALARILEREWTKAFKPLGLTPSQAFMLRVVLAQAGLLQSQLADVLAISRATTSRTLDGLQKLAFVDRRATEADGRESAIYPTPAAMTMKAALQSATSAVTSRLKRELGNGKFEQTVASVREVRSIID